MTTGDAAPRTFGGRYVLGDRLTGSESREVWRAHDDVVSRQVALKIFFGPRAADPAWQSRFSAAGDRLVALSHPGIAKVYEHGTSSSEAWLAMAFVGGIPLTNSLDGAQPLGAGTALSIVGQTALAVSAAHDRGLVHGNLTPDNLLIRGDGIVSVIGFAVGGAATQEDDLRALGQLANDCLRGALAARPQLTSEVHDFLGWVTDPDRPNSPADAASIGSTALALAASLSGKHGTSVVPSAREHSAMDDTAGAPPRYDEAERKMVRNRLLVLGTIVVVGGGALLRFVGEGGGDVVVPSEVSKPVNQAKLDLISHSLNSKETISQTATGSGGTVVSQSPAPGQQVKAGSTVTLVIAVGAP